VLEGESSLPGDCTAIGRTVIHDLPGNLPKNWPIEVTFEYGANGRLTVRGAVPGTDRQTTLELERDVGLSSEGISRWKRVMGGVAGFDQFEGMLQEVLNLPAVAQGPVTSPPAAVGPLNGRHGDARPPSGRGPAVGPADPAIQPAVPWTPPNPAVPAGPIPFVPVLDGPKASPGSYEPTLAYVPPPPAAPSQPEIGQPSPILSQPTPLFSHPGGMQSQPIPSYGQPTPMGSPMAAAVPTGAGPTPRKQTVPAPGLSPDQAGLPLPERFAAPDGKARSRVSRRMFSLIGLGISSAAGLGLGYLLYKAFLRADSDSKTGDGDTKDREAEPPSKNGESGNPSPNDRPQP